MSEDTGAALPATQPHRPPYRQAPLPGKARALPHNPHRAYRTRRDVGSQAPHPTPQPHNQVHYGCRAHLSHPHHTQTAAGAGRSTAQRRPGRRARRPPGTAARDGMRQGRGRRPDDPPPPSLMARARHPTNPPSKPPTPDLTGSQPGARHTPLPVTRTNRPRKDPRRKPRRKPGRKHAAKTRRNPEAKHPQEHPEIPASDASLRSHGMPPANTHSNQQQPQPRTGTAANRPTQPTPKNASNHQQVTPPRSSGGAAGWRPHVAGKRSYPSNMGDRCGWCGDVLPSGRGRRYCPRPRPCRQAAYRTHRRVEAAIPARVSLLPGPLALGRQPLTRSGRCR